MVVTAAVVVVVVGDVLVKMACQRPRLCPNSVSHYRPRRRLIEALSRSGSHLGVQCRGAGSVGVCCWCQWEAVVVLEEVVEVVVTVDNVVVWS